MYKDDESWFLIDGRLWHLVVDTDWYDDETHVVGYLVREYEYDPAFDPAKDAWPTELSSYADADSSFSENFELTDLQVRMILHNHGFAQWTPEHETLQALADAEGALRSHTWYHEQHRRSAKDCKARIATAVEDAQRNYDTALRHARASAKQRATLKTVRDTLQAQLDRLRDPT